MRDPKTHTKQGFLRAHLLSDEQIDGILAEIAAGGMEGEVCRRFGTSYSQLVRRIRSDPALKVRYRAADVEKWRSRTRLLQSEHAENNPEQ